MADTLLQIDVTIKEVTKNELLAMLGGTPQEAAASFIAQSKSVLRQHWKGRLQHHREQALENVDPVE